ncbi:oxidoreductase [Lentilactobacillus fungorum]|uniref:Oxidoreductase n=1 Tax=Lentilactobacillus fungorum TaxID=2201250 RepID=A0ABQ3W2W8_9LACO|nr:Gfo/Idh/MocA family oxidoreductase [Lentilactobacillus fungorum]GHP14731.1 oxidoreductase [Lentilactobacillus fungorum]
MIKLGTIGTNWITQQFVEAVKLSKVYDLTSIYSRHEQTAKAFADKNDAKEYFTDLDAFFDNGNFDTVYIASPNSLHFDQAKMAILHGKNVIVEKPAFSNQKQMAQIQELLDDHPDVLYFEGARNIHTANFHAIESKLAQMQTLQGAEFTYSKYSSRYDNVLAGEEPNVFSLKYAGGALQDLGVYTVYDAVALFGMPQEVAYFPQLVRTGVDGKGTAILSYPEYTVTLNFSKVSNSYMTSEIYGLKDLISIDDAGELRKITYIDENQHQQVIGSTVDQNPMLPEAVDFARVINDPTNEQNRKDYAYWRQLSMYVNKLLYNLRQDAHLYFVGEQD